MEDIDAIGILKEFIAKGTAAKDKWFSWRTIVCLEQHLGRSRACYCYLDLIDLLLKLVH